MSFLCSGGAKLRISAGGREVTVLAPATPNDKQNLGTCAKVLLRLFRARIAAETAQNHL